VAGGSLEGDWRVERVRGVLPPVAISKQVEGTSGVTRIGPFRIPFRVVGMTLRYRPPLQAFVDELEPNGEGFVGRATVLGREYACFRLVPDAK
jgi:hypothetical protein